MREPVNLSSLQKAADVLSVCVLLDVPSVPILLDQYFGPLFLKYFMLKHTVFYNIASRRAEQWSLDKGSNHISKEHF